MTDQLHTIDGSQGEGGGQILRSSLALALVTGRAVRLENIRAGREKPGLMRQHLTAVRAAVEIGAAEVEGDEIGSQTLSFRPTAIRPCQRTFSVGTAGSATLVLQTILPALLIADGPSEIVLEGGTHNPWAPPYDFLAQSFFPLINRMGPRVSAGLERHGFYPAGGGRFSVAIEPTPQLVGFDLLERGEILHRSATALVANLSSRIGRREIEAAAEKLSWPDSAFHVDASIESAGPGNVFLIEIHSEHVREVFTGFGRLGATAERVANEAVKEARSYLAAGVPVGPYLADQLLLPLGIAAWQTGQGGSFATQPLTRHSQTHIDLLRSILEIPISVEREGNCCLVTVGKEMR
ncbi:MAG: RNA 3'-terminal phosphate cyclase [Planctomycetaceae bacterium]|nr:RNA 3'-terminal phosphate cyclase [Planctomycetaceae bacterium]